jgi:hypothetical protein
MARPPGIPNKSTMRVAHICEIKGYDSIEAMIQAAQIALEKFIEHSANETNRTWSPMESKANDYLKIYAKIATDMAQFIHPKRKAVEHTSRDITENMTPQEKLQAMKQAVLMLENQINKENGNGNQ